MTKVRLTILKPILDRRMDAVKASNLNVLATTLCHKCEVSTIVSVYLLNLAFCGS